MGGEAREKPAFAPLPRRPPPQWDSAVRAEVDAYYAKQPPIPPAPAPEVASSAGQLSPLSSQIPPEQLESALRSLYGLSEAREAEAAAAAAAADAAVAEGGGGKGALPAAPRKRTLLEGDVTWARALAASFDRLDSWVEWRVLRRDRILPAVARLQQTCLGIEPVREWLQASSALAAAGWGRCSFGRPSSAPPPPHPPGVHEPHGRPRHAHRRAP